MNKVLVVRIFLLGLMAGALLPGMAFAAPPGNTHQAQSEAYHVVQSGQNLFRISLQYGTSVQALMQANGIADPTRVYVGQRLRIPLNNASPAASPAPAAPASAETNTHVVQAGENLYRIGLRYGMTAQALAWANGLSNVNMVYVGQRLFVPAASGLSSVSPSNPASAPPLILQVPVDAQDHTLSCEASAAGMAAAFYQPAPPSGYATWEQYFIQAVPQHRNPHRGFRGSIDGQQGVFQCADNWCPGGYGVYAEPLAQALQNAGLEATVEYGVDCSAVHTALKNGQPVMVWIFQPLYYRTYDSTMRWVEVDEETHQAYTLIEGEHVVVVAGVSGDGKNFLIHDPYLGRVYWVSRFNHWELFDGMRVIVGERSN